MKPSVDPAKVAAREMLARQMAEWEAKNGPVKTLPIGISADYDGYTTKEHREMMREKARKAAVKTAKRRGGQ